MDCLFVRGGNLHLALEWASNVKTEVLSLNWGQGGQLGVNVCQMKEGNGLVQNLRKDIDTNIELAGLAELNILGTESSILGLEQQDLCKNLVGERARHNEGRVTSGTSQVNETTLGEKNDVTAVLHEETIDLGLDVGNACSVFLQPGDINLNIEVTNV